MLICAALLLAGCASPGPAGVAPRRPPRDISLPPLVSQGVDVDDTRVRDVFWPLYHEHENKTERGFGVRPLFYHVKKKGKLDTETVFLWPLGRYSVRPGQAEVRLTPFFSYKARFGEHQILDADWIIFPLIFVGTDKKEGRYFGFFPFGGQVRGLLGKSKIEFWMFPLYMKTYDVGTKGTYAGTHWLFPLYQDGEGQGKSSFAVLPFYAAKKKEGQYDRRSYLWPIVHLQWNQLHTDDPIRTIAVLPFYGQDISTSGKNVSRTFLWPFFSYRIHSGTGYREFNLPWPFFRSLKSEKIDHFRLWPFYSRWHNKEKKIVDYQILWPLGWYSTYDEPTYTKQSTWALPFYWDHHKQYKDEEKTSERFTKIWPLYHRHRRRDGGVEHQLLSLWWFEDYAPYGFTNSYDDLFAFYRYRSRPSGEWSLSLLGPLFKHYASRKRVRHRTLFFEYEREGVAKRQATQYKFLEGLFTYRNDRGAKSLGLFWFPELIRWGETGRRSKR